MILGHPGLNKSVLNQSIPLGAFLTGCKLASGLQVAEVLYVLKM
jgi:hypothetical protein